MAWVEVRCKHKNCSKVHTISEELGQDAFCPPSSKHRNWVPMVKSPGAAVAEARRAMLAERKEVAA